MSGTPRARELIHRRKQGRALCQWGSGAAAALAPLLRPLASRHLFLATMIWLPDPFPFSTFGLRPSQKVAKYRAPAAKWGASSWRPLRQRRGHSLAHSVSKVCLFSGRCGKSEEEDKLVWPADCRAEEWLIGDTHSVCFIRLNIRMNLKF